MFYSHIENDKYRSLLAKSRSIFQFASFCADDEYIIIERKKEGKSMFMSTWMDIIFRVLNLILISRGIANDAIFKVRRHSDVSLEHCRVSYFLSLNNLSSCNENDTQSLCCIHEQSFQLTCFKWFFNIVPSGSGRAGISSYIPVGAVSLFESKSTNQISSGNLIENVKIRNH